MPAQPRPLIIAIHGAGMGITSQYVSPKTPEIWRTPFPEFTKINMLDAHTAYVQSDRGMVLAWRNDADDNPDVEYIMQCYRHAKERVAWSGEAYLMGFSDGASVMDSVLRHYSHLFLGAVRHSGAWYPRKFGGSVGAKRPGRIWICSGDGREKAPADATASYTRALRLGNFVEKRAQLASQDVADVYGDEGWTVKLSRYDNMTHRWNTAFTQAAWSWLQNRIERAHESS